MFRLKYIWIHGLVVGVLVALGINVAIASRNSGGTYSLPNPAVVTGTNISSTWANSTLNDLATEITNSLDRSGRGAMTGPLRLKSSASAAAPDLAWDVETNTGFYRAAAGDFRFAIAGVDLMQYGASGASIKGTTPISMYHDIGGVGAGLWIGSATTGSPTSANYAFIGDGTSVLMNAATGGQARLRVNNVDGVTVSGTSITTSLPLVIGGTGTAISQSNRGTLAIGGGTINAQTCANQSVTVTGAVIGSECSAGYSTVVNVNFVTSCSVTATNVCTVTTCNLMATNQAAPANTLACRVWNP